VDEQSALCVEADGTAKLRTRNGGFAWLVQPKGRPAVERGKPLDWDHVRVTGIGTGSGFDLNSLRVTAPAFVGTARVSGGRLLNAPKGPSPAPDKPIR
jgi:hypothetical protein